MPQIKNIQRTTATSGTVTVNDTGDDILVIHEAGVTVSLTIALPANPTDGQQVTISSASGITSVSMTTAVGSIINALTTLVAGGAGRYIYLVSQTKWYKV